MLFFKFKINIVKYFIIMTKVKINETIPLMIIILRKNIIMINVHFSTYAQQ